jgi:hexosaminidase
LALLAFLAFGPAEAAGSSPGQAALDLMPVPESVDLRDGRFRVVESLSIGGQSVPWDRAFGAAARFMSRLAGRTGLFLEQDFLASQKMSAAAVVYDFERAGKLEPFEDESYALTVGPDKIVLSATTDLGVLHGLETLLQLLAADEEGYYFPCVEIRDRPRFTWRGLLIDSGRHFQPVEVIKRNLDGMAALKMNVLHWHLTEDQGFRVESKAFPGLHRLGSDGLFYTQAQVREIIGYAAERGIRVMPEFDVPGHSTSWFVAYPELASAPGPYAIERRFGVAQPAFNPADERIYTFLDRFFGEMASLFPDLYLHIGGDEVEGHHWDANPAIQAFKKKNGLADNHALQAYFNRRLLKILTRHGKRMVGWDEIFQPGMPSDIVIQSWRGQEALVESARKGIQALLSNGYYIDLCQPAETHYLNDPIPEGSPLDEAQRKLVLGGEATMWSELVTPETIDSRIWPRTAAIAERLWSRPDVRDVEDMYRRLAIVSLRLEERGLTHLKNQDMMLRRLASGPDIGPLKVLAGVVEPLKNYARHSQGLTYRSLSPLTRFVDACAPESLEARRFRSEVGGYLSSRDRGAALTLRRALAAWVDNHALVRPLAARAPALREIEPLSLALADAARTGLTALDHLESGERPSPEWVELSRKRLAEAGRPMAHAELAVVRAIGKLLEACAGPAG